MRWFWQPSVPSPVERRGVNPRMEKPPLLDIICVAGILALGAIVALVGKGVEKL